MRVEDRTGVATETKDKIQIILICETEEESMIVDKLGNLAKVKGELHLSDGYGEFYIRLEPVEGGG